MRKAARRKVQRGAAIPEVTIVPAPTLGWNRRDPLAAMQPGFAVVLDNFIPGTGDVSLRNGFSNHATGLGDFIETLMEYSGPTGTNELFAATPDSIFNVTANTAVGSAELTSLNSGRWQHTMFATSAGNFLVACNGADDVINYDGASWTEPSISNVTSSNLIHVVAHANRLWFVEKNKLDIWYLSVQAIAGAATKLPLGSYCKRGGYVMALGSWSLDGGAGPDDVLVAVTSEGEVVIFSGTDPASPDTWSQQGTYIVPPPIGRRCLMKAGADLGILTATGLVPLSKVLAANQSGQELVAITDNINGAYQDFFRRAGSNFGWQVIEHPRKQLLFVNVPYKERVTQYQFVMNIRSGGWCRFTGMNAGCWSLLGDELYFGDNAGTVWKYTNDYRDDDATIAGVMQPAFSNLGTPVRKLVTAARAMCRGPLTYTPAVEIKTDYDTTAPTAAASVTASDGPKWDSIKWDTTPWGSVSLPRAVWQSATGEGIAIAPAMGVSLSQEFVLNHIDLLFEPSGKVDA